MVMNAFRRGEAFGELANPHSLELAAECFALTFYGIIDRDLSCGRMAANCRIAKGGGRQNKNLKHLSLEHFHSSHNLS